MNSTYFKMAHRSLMANKGTTLINVLGLVIGIASALVIASVIRFEQSFDSFHSKKDDIYRVVRITGKDDPEYRSGIVYPLHEAMRAEIPGVEVIPVEYLGGSSVDVLSSDGKTLKKFIEDNGLAAIGPDFFQMFDFAGQPIKWISGSPETSLTDPSGIVITRSIALKYFGDEDPMNKTLRFMKILDARITGVVEDFPANTDFPFTMMFSEGIMEQIFGKQRLNEWVSVNDSHAVFVYAPNMSEAQLNQYLDRIHAAHVGKDISDSRHYRVQEFSEVHYDPRFGNFSGRTITHETILALEIIVLFLLLAGSINYINLATAQSTLRSKEIGLRKVLGSRQIQLVIQILTETFIVVFIAAVLAIGLVYTFMPFISDVLNIRISYELTDPQILTSLAAVVILVTLISGLYPAFVISKFNPVTALRSKFSIEKVGGFNLRKLLVVAQFTITQILAVGTFIVIAQMNYFQNVDMGFNRKAVIINLNTQTANDPQSRREIISELGSLPFVSSTSQSFTLPSGHDRNHTSRSIGALEAASANDFKNYEHFSIDENFLDLYQLKLIAGRNLTVNDSTSANILINETLMKDLGFENSSETIGRQVKVGDGVRATIVGIVGDFYSNSLKEGITNTAMFYQPEKYRWLSIRLDLNSQQSMASAVSGIEKIWNKHFPDHIFQYSFFDENINNFYQQELKYSRLFQIFSLVFIAIGCLGLYGLITFIANKKGKEIGVRKTLGATISNIIVMFSKEYVTLIVVSFVLAAPIVWYGVNEWLSSFKNHIDLQWWMFITPGLIVLSVALIVVGSKSYIAASVNPVEKLKCE